ncbi:hypothetical protein [Mycobacterium shimoidei]|uniref:hypothetical protein n=1 Tax=Mycobacterium shimoidei TaxID=29313 RepID=UPI00084886C3|nr:hypothetical protein [Mycobacterium shimoidei]MCV7258804.1 hypothetical protein [Mycobacterium shimoidei]ODR15295.1 hypothetical protein BHQ16_00675 [Mycobacterium shimoidei]ORW79875.1 hypothetical protein AWC26_13270 [Mycobacterium shimoidei]
MPEPLRVDVDGLRLGAAQSAGIAAALAAGTSGGSGGSQASHAGVAAVDAALIAMRDRLSGRANGQASSLSAAGSRYGDTDEQSGGSIAETV